MGTAVITAPDSTYPARPERRGRIASLAPIAAITALAGILYGWRIGGYQTHVYYDAAVRSMTESWHNFFYSALDPAGFLAVDKLPGPLWVQAVSELVFGDHAWARLLPGLLLATATVPILYDTVRLWMGRRAGLVAAAVLALSPVTVALARENLHDIYLIPFTVAAANLVTRAMRNGRLALLLLAGALLGVAFYMKSTEMFLALPALAVAYLVAAPGGAGTRIRQLLIAGLVTAVISVAWVLAVALTPKGSRPFIDGTTSSSPWEMAFLYNGLDRIIPRAGAPAFVVSFGGEAGWNRLVNQQVGDQIAWLLPFAFIALVVGLVRCRGRQRTDLERAGWLLWTVWLVMHVVVFSAADGIHPFYTATMVPAIAALCGGGVIAMVDLWGDEGARGWVPVGAIAVTGAWATYLAARDGGFSFRPWLAPTIAVATAVACAALVAVRSGRLSGLATAGLAAALVAGLLGPATWAQATLTQPVYPFSPTAGKARSYPPLFVRVLPYDPAFRSYLEQQRRDERYLFATIGSMPGSAYIGAGVSVLPTGGFTGTAAAPTLAELDGLVRAGQVRFMLVGPINALPVYAPRVAWVGRSCRPVDPQSFPSRGITGWKLFDCRP